MKNIVTLLSLTTALTVSVIASDAVPQVVETSAWFMVEPVENGEEKAGKSAKDTAGKFEEGSEDDWDKLDEAVASQGEKYAQSRFTPDTPEPEGSQPVLAGGISKTILNRAATVETPATIEAVVLPHLTEKQAICLSHFFQTKEVSAYTDVRAKWLAYQVHLNTIIEKLMAKKGYDIGALTAKRDALQKCDALMGTITESMFRALQKEYAPTRD